MSTYFFRTVDYINDWYEFVLLYNTSAPEAGAVYLNEMNKAIIRSATDNPNFDYRVTIDPMPLTYR